MQKVQVFNYQSKQLRAVQKDGEPWFASKDIYNILKIHSMSVIFGILRENMKGSLIIDTPGGKQRTNIISESGVYLLVATSKKPETVQFTNWLATVVLPALYGNDVTVNDSSPITEDMTVKDAPPVLDKNKGVMDELQIFNYKSNQVRTIQKNGEPWFVAKDVCDVLNHSNSRKALSDHCDQDDVTKSYIGVNTGLGEQQVEANFINESGVYSLVFGSTLPEAKQFKRWITHEVIPSIRKHGAYMTPETIEKAICNPDFIINLATKLKEANSIIEAQKPKVLFADSVATSDSSILIGDLAKILKQNGVDTGEKRLFTWLRDNGYLIKRKGAGYNSPTQKSMELGLFVLKESFIVTSEGVKIVKTTKVTGKGQLYFTAKFIAA